MSRWLNSVNSLLEQLDGQVETAIDERALARAEEGEEDTQVQGKDAVDSILARRGLVAAPPEEEENALELGVAAEEESVPVNKVNAEPDDALVTVEEDVARDALQELVQGEKEAGLDDPRGDPESEKLPEIAVPEEKSYSVTEAFTKVPVQDDEGADAFKKSTFESASVPPEAMDTDTLPPEETEQNEEESVPAEDPAHSDEPPLNPDTEMLSTKQEPPRSAPAGLDLIASGQHDYEKEYRETLAESREAHKEARTLRRHVVALNEELETAEAEIKAQRTELERAAERMEKDRARHKEEKESAAARQAEETKALKAQHEQVLKEHKARADQQLEDARQRIRGIEERRMQEGGDWTKELEVSVQREQEAAGRVTLLEDEKSTLLSQVSSLQAQMAALDNRLESTSQTADSAMEREREAEDRLDAALSMHARQLTQRQARESELERTVADLGAALVVARNKELNRLKSEQQAGVTSDSGDAGSLTARLEAAEDELETLKAQLDLERQRAQILHQELRDVSRERTEESSAMHARQLQSDRRIADLTTSISRLQANARESIASEGCGTISPSDDYEKDRQIKSLSEQLIRHQDKLGKSTSEAKALKNRLQTALSRAEQAEVALASANNDAYDTMERAPSSGDAGDGRRGVRRRGRTRSIRSAMKLDPGQGAEKFAKAIDVVDSFSVETGKYLRYNPIARGTFILYLLLLHLWALALLAFHAHSYETVHADLRELPHGPHALMQQYDPSKLSP